MRFVHAALLLAVMASPAFAQREPEIVIPGRLGVPVIINGVDASWGVVVGEFGLDRPGVMAPTVIYRPLLISVPDFVPGYFPHGKTRLWPPRNRAAARAAEAASGADLLSQLVEPVRAGPVTDYPSYPMPPVVVAPTIDGCRMGRPYSITAGPHDPPRSIRISRLHESDAIASSGSS